MVVRHLLNYVKLVAFEEKDLLLRLTHDPEELQDGCGSYCKMSLNTVDAPKSVLALRASRMICEQLQLYSSGKRLERDFIDSSYAAVHLNSMLYRSHYVFTTFY